jgi:lipopolysaccharide transport system permease protein
MSNETLSIETKPKWHFRVQRTKGWSMLNLRELWSYRDLFGILAGRDIRLRYKQTALGVLWVVLQPLLASGIFAVIFGMLADLPSGEVPYFVFAFAGLLPWNLFSQSLSRAGGSLVGSREMISKVYFPRMILPISSSLAVLVDFFVSLAMMIIMLLLYQLPLTARLLWLPILIVINLVFAIGTSFWISAFSVYYRDFIYALPFLIQAWMYASPVAYSSSLIPEKWLWLYSLNPMVGVIEGFRWVLLDQGEFPAISLLIGFMISFMTLLIGALIFRRIERSFADVI